jgi:hypothetical protein
MIQPTPAASNDQRVRSAFEQWAWEGVTGAPVNLGEVEQEFALTDLLGLEYGSDDV